MLAQHIRAQGTDQGCNRTENNVRQRSTRDEVGKEASGEQARDRSRRKERQNSQSLRKSALNHTACEVKAPGENRQRDIKSCNDSRLRDK